jgi:hypothetical protein
MHRKYWTGQRTLLEMKVCKDGILKLNLYKKKMDLVVATQVSNSMKKLDELELETLFTI